MRELKDRDIIEKIHGIYDVKEPDVLHRLDFSDADMVPPPEKNLNRRYISAIAVYTAACLVVTACLPFIIGGGTDDPRPNPSMTATETHSVTGERSVDSEEVSEYISDYDTDHTDEETKDSEETVTAAETDEPEITVPAETEAEPAETEVEPAIPEPEPEPAKPVETEPPVTTAPVVTTKTPVETDKAEKDEDVKTEPEIVDPTPENMVHDKIDIPYTLIRYSGGWSDSLARLLEHDLVLQEYGYSEEEVRNLGVDQTWPEGDEGYIRVIKTKKQFDTFAAQIKDGLEADLVNEGAFAEFAKDFEYFDEAYFEKYDLVFWGFGETVHGIDYQVNNLSYFDDCTTNGKCHFFVNNEYINNEFWIQLVKTMPTVEEMIPADVAAENRTTELVLIAFEKDDVENVQDEMHTYGTVSVFNGGPPEDGKNMTDIDMVYYQGPYKIDVTEEEALDIVKERLYFAQGSNVYPYTDGDVLSAGELTGIQNYKCELTEWKGFPVYDISFYSMSELSGTVYRVTLQVYANERCQKSSIIRNRPGNKTDATAKRVDNYSMTERATESVAWNTNNSSDNIMYTYYEYADSTSMKLLWEAADLENSKYDVTYDNLVNGLPMLVFDNYKDYSDFISSTYDEYTATGSEAYDFFEDSEKYDEEYFKDNVLVIVGVMNKDNSVDNRMKVDLYNSSDDENTRKISVTITSYIPGLGDGRYYDPYVFTEEDEIEYKMYVYEFARAEGEISYMFGCAQFRNYPSNKIYSYTPYEERQTYYVIKEKNKNKVS